MVWSKESQNSGSSGDNSWSDLADTWVELESDPGLFTLLIEDFGVRGVQVEEIYDLNSASSLENSTVYGFIFLFKWVEGGRRGRGASIASSTSGTTVTDEDIVNRMFFAQQIVTNACATHALLSILLNCDEEIELGAVLTEFKQQTYGMGPEAKGHAVGKSAPLAWAHNKHARPDARRQMERDSSTSDNSRGKSVRHYRWESQEQFHFISYLPVNGRLYELDGLKSHPVDHGEIPPGMLWTQYFQNVISERIGLINTILDANEIRYNLMALVPSKLDQLRRSLEMLQMNRQVLYNGLEKLLEATDPKVLAIARQQASRKPQPASDDDASVSWAVQTETSRLDQATLIGAAKDLESSQDAASMSAPLTVVTSTGRETVVDSSVSSGATDQSAFVWPISALEVVTVTKGSDDAAKQGTVGNMDGPGPGLVGTPVSTSPLSSLSGRDDAEHTRSSMDTSTVCNVGCNNMVEPSSAAEPRQTEHDDVKQPDATKSVLVVKLETSGSNGFRLLGPLGLVTYIRRLEDKVALVERLLNDEVAGRQQWEIDDERRTHDYDPFIRTFLTVLVKESVITPSEFCPKNGKTKSRRESRGGTAGRKRRYM